MLKWFSELDDELQTVVVVGSVGIGFVMGIAGPLMVEGVISNVLEHKQEMAKVQALEAGVPYHYLWELPGNHVITPGAVLGEGE